MKRLKRLIALTSFALLATACNGLGSVSGSTTISAPTKSAQLSWTAGTGVITGYKIEQSPDNSNFTEVQTVGNTTSATVAGLLQGTTYYFRVKAYNVGGESPDSSVATLPLPAINN